MSYKEVCSPCLSSIYKMYSFRSLEENVHVYSHKVEEVKPVTNQKSSGRCWLFACLNVARQPFVKHYNLEDFEFSQAHLFYWDKIERANYFLQNISKSREFDLIYLEIDMC